MAKLRPRIFDKARGNPGRIGRGAILSEDQQAQAVRSPSPNIGTIDAFASSSSKLVTFH